ncbi:MarR family winged helix-turn-helix transcriptional regulator [Phytohabitans rumicis]|uniref:MarR family transcriptional regulator n=1 Tax=Phytohabitans rumicis TaxID=1076125 RepID=A0A6V8KXA7_9ACTN|nr:MarR family winged helix-turn-helix transcriptional regulator [Phytohabitans rumicis]GFJ86939.1 MarR family transcriptional regulator [Phytohabitans rumicis]
MADGGEPATGGVLDGVTWALRRAELAVQTFKERQLRTMGLAAAHYSLLMCVHAEPGRTGAEVARRLAVTPQNVASLVAKMEDRGLVERRSHPRHGHVQELHLTDAGREALRAAEPTVTAIDRRIATELGPAETAHLAALLNRVADMMSR